MRDENAAHSPDTAVLEPVQQVSLSRRQWLGRLVGRGQGSAAASSGLTAGLAASFWAGAPQAHASGPEVSADVDPSALLSKLVRRATMGLTEYELNLARSLGYQGYLEYHLNHTAIDDSFLNERLVPLNTLTMQYFQLAPIADGTVMNQLAEAMILRGVYSRRQLFERMVEFWTDHFSIDQQNGYDRYLKTIDDRDVIRANALGSFATMLSASAHSPAMLYYLDNYVSTNIAPNENYAREIMELHTLGVDGGYTQTDVEEVARCFTGWGIFPFNAGVLGGTFRYLDGFHDQGQKIVLGNIIPPFGGMQDAVTVLNILIDHPSTARYVSRKLAHWLLGYNVPQTVVDDIAAAYTRTRGDIKEMIRTALKPNYLHDAEPKYKRPFHAYVSAIRATDTSVLNTTNIRAQLQGVGHRPYWWTTPDGYPDSIEHWMGFILPRWNFMASMLNNEYTGVTTNTGLFYQGATLVDQMIERIDQRLFGGEMPSYDRTRIQNFLLPNPSSAQQMRDALGLALASPGFQWY